MKHIVFVIGYYYPEAGSTSVCAIKVMDALQKLFDVEISCICGTEGEQKIELINNICVYRIKHRSYTEQLNKKRSQLSKIITRMAKHIVDFIHIWQYPDMDVEYSKKIAQKLEEIELKKHIDGIVSVYMPKQTISGTMMFLNRHRDVRSVAYFLDTLRSNKPKHMPAILHNMFINRFEEKVFSSFDKTILMKYGHDYYQKELCAKYREKISYLDLPSLEFYDLQKEKPRGRSCYYVGTTYSDIRDPSFAMRVFDNANKKDPRISFHIFGSSNMTSSLIEWQSQHCDSFQYHGYISHEEIAEVYEKADYIVSIGNRRKGVLPGKTFEIVGTLKPIIHFSDMEYDDSLQYIKRYPNVCIIDNKMSVDEAADTVLAFLSKPYVFCERSEVHDVFKYAEPEFASKLIYSTCLE